MGNKKKVKYEFIDYLFWFLFILFTNPGGIFKALGEDTSSVGSVDSFDFLFFLILGCFLYVSHKTKIQDKTYKKVVKYLIIFGLYYFIIFGFFVPTLKEVPNYTLFQFIKKSRKTVYSLLLFIITYRFILRSQVLFVKYLVVSTIIITFLFFVTFLTGIEILPIQKFDRRFVSVERYFLTSYGLMDMLIPMGAILLVFKQKFKWRKIMLIGFMMMFLTYILSITRRDIIGTFVYVFIALMLYNYFEHKPLIPVKKMISVAFFAVIFGFLISLSFPKYYQAGAEGMKEAYHVIRYGETSSGREDVRMGFGKDFMQNLIKKNYVFGTGFDNRWRGTGDKLGYETSDYPFLSAIAMTGLVGLSVFLPLYIVLVHSLIKDIKFLRKNKVNYQTFEFYVLIFSILYFIYDLLQYMNWFLPLSLSRKFKWYVLFAVYLASRQLFYRRVKLDNIKKNKALKYA